MRFQHEAVSLILFASMLFALGACSSDDNEDQSSNASDTNNSPEERQDEAFDDATKEID